MFVFGHQFLQDPLTSLSGEEGFVQDGVLGEEVEQRKRKMKREAREETGSKRDLMARERNENPLLKPSQNCIVQLMRSVRGSHDQHPLPGLCCHLE